MSNVAPLKKQNMKSKVQFDLNGLNKAVITAKIAYTEDVRDKVANVFNEGFGYDSILATAYHTGVSSYRDDDGSERMIKTVEIRPVGSLPEDCDKLASLMCDTHLANLFRSINREINFRKRTGEGNDFYDDSFIRPSRVYLPEDEVFVCSACAAPKE